MATLVQSFGEALKKDMLECGGTMNMALNRVDQKSQTQDPKEL